VVGDRVEELRPQPAVEQRSQRVDLEAVLVIGTRLELASKPRKAMIAPR
jgi:hypothetical protein